MRFGKNRKPPPYLNRRDQLRMLAMVGLLTLIVVAIKIASKPSSWYWLTGPPPATTNQSTAELGNRHIDHSVRSQDDQPLPPGVFRARVESQSTARPQAAGDPPTTSDPEDVADTADTAGPQAVFVPADPLTAAAASVYQVEIDAAVFSSVHDNTLGIRRAEKEAHDYVLAKARAIPLSYLERAAQRQVAFAVLMTDSDRFRGQLITVEGEVWRLVRFPAAKNSYGIDELYEAWLVSADSGENLYRFVCTSLPDRMPQGERLDEPLRVRVTGYFFKRFGYAAERGLHTAPLLLGKRPRWFPPRAATQADDVGLAHYVLSFVIGVAVVLGLTLWRFSLSDRKFQETHLKRLTAAPQDAITALDDVETSDLGQFFRELSQEQEE